MNFPQTVFAVALGALLAIVSGGLIIQWMIIGASYLESGEFTRFGVIANMSAIGWGLLFMWVLISASEPHRKR